MKSRKTNIYVFKTSVINKTQINRLKPKINSIIAISTWNFDLEDCDKILRVESEKNICQRIITILKTYQFECVELD